MGPKTKGKEKGNKGTSKQSQTEPTPMNTTEANQTQNQTFKKMTKIGNYTIEKVQQSNEQHEFNENKGSNLSRSWDQLEDQNIKDSNSQYNPQQQNSKKVKTTRIQQTINNKIPPFAQLILDIILKIAKYPKKQELEKASLVDQICQIIEEFSKNLEKKNKQYFEQVKQKIKRLQSLFKEGIKRGYAFQQQRIKDAANITGMYNIKENVITFHPTYTVTGQIMRQLIFGLIKNYGISFGHQGIAKTFAYYLYHQLSNMFISQVISCEQSVVQAFFKQKTAKIQFPCSENQKLFLNIPKLIYWTMIIQSGIEDGNLIKLFLRQCPQIQHQIKLVNEENKKISFKKFVEQLCQLYRNKGITVYLVVDQINKIASSFRNYFIAQQKTKSNLALRVNKQYKDLLKKYQQADKLNDFRHQLLSIKQGFQCIFYNSSVNLETFFEMDEASSNDVYQKIKEQLKLYGQQEHAQRQCVPYRIFYPEIVKLESSIWSLTDTVIFELKKLNKLSVLKQEMGEVREKIYEYLKKKGSSVVITFLRIAGAIQNFQNKVTVQNIEGAMGEILEIVEKIEKKWLKTNLDKFKKKFTEPEEPLEAIAIIYDYMHEKLQAQQQATEKKTETFIKELSFLQTPIFVKTESDSFLLNNLNRHLFLFFDNSMSFKKYFSKLKNELNFNLSSWLGKQYENEKINQQLEQFQSKIKSKFQSKNEFGFSLLSPDIVISLLKPEIRKLSSIKSANYAKILNRFQSSTLASVFEVQLVNHLKTSSEKVKFNHLRYPSTQNKQFKQLSELPKANYNQNTKENLNKEFLTQFLISDKQREQNSYLFTPETQTSKSVDFAIQNIFYYNEEKIQIYQVYLFQVTFIKDNSKLILKIKLFLSSFKEAAKSFKKNLNGEKLNVYFVLIGGNMNDNNGIKKAIDEMNSNLKKQKSNFLKEISYLNINSIEVPKCSEFFNQVMKIMKKYSIPQKKDKK